MSRQSPKHALFAQFAGLAKALGHAHRLELLEQVAQGERSVEVLAQRTKLSIANALWPTPTPRKVESRA